tara:strand:+ start:936 stop:1634 length:699 start_codon:yes stop_codon:yes gene_type:complete
MSLWLDSDDKPSHSLAGSSLTDWADKSSNALNFSQATGSAQPTAVEADAKNKRAIDFDGGDDMDCDTTTNVVDSSEAFTAIFVFESDSMTAYPCLFQWKGNKNLEWLILSAANYSDISFGNNATWYKGKFASGDISLGTTYCVVLVFDGVDPAAGGSFSAYLDGTSKSISASAAYGAHDAAQTMLGNDTYGDYFNGRLYELCVWKNRELTTGEINREGQRLKDKWGHSWTNL